MEKEIIVKIKYEFDEPYDISNTDEFIINDLETEINCCSNYYDIISIDINKTN